jgi:hypothetical protein
MSEKGTDIADHSWLVIGDGLESDSVDLNFGFDGIDGMHKKSGDHTCERRGNGGGSKFSFLVDLLFWHFGSFIDW